MPKVNQDFKVKPNRQSQRAEIQSDLWDVRCGGEMVVTVSGQEKAQEIADMLNNDPYALERGQTRRDRANYVPVVSKY